MWLVGVDEAGYGPNLGPFVMSCVACRVPERHRGADLWELLGPVVCRRKGDADRLFIDDSKRVYTARGLAGLERGILASLWGEGGCAPAVLSVFVGRACPDHQEELTREVWYRGTQPLPVHLGPGEWAEWTDRFGSACVSADIGCWHFRSLVVCPRRFNSLLDEGGKKGHVLAHGLSHLLRWSQTSLDGPEGLSIVVDKHGGRNSYAALIQHALPDGLPVVEQEGMARSSYRVEGLGREVRLTIEPRADASHLCVALASMLSKYLREVLMLEFNRFWSEHVPGLKPTAGYPGDADRFFQAIRPAVEKIGLREDCVWRRK